MKEWVARNKTVPMQVLGQLAVNVDPRVRLAVAMKNKLSKDLVLTLAKDSDPSIRERIAYNENASDEVLTGTVIVYQPQVMTGKTYWTLKLSAVMIQKEKSREGG